MGLAPIEPSISEEDRPVIVARLVHSSRSVAETLSEVRRRSQRIELLAQAIGDTGKLLVSLSGSGRRDAYVHVLCALNVALAGEW